MIKNGTPYFILLLLTFLVSFPINAQEIPDSLDYSTRIIDKKLALEIRDEIEYFSKNNTTYAFYLINTYGNKILDKAIYADIIFFKGVTYRNAGNLEAAGEHFYRALSIYDSLNLPKKIARAYNGLSVYFADLQQKDESVEFLKKSLEINQNLSNNTEVARNYHNLGMVYLEKTDYDSALYYLQLSKELCVKYNAEVTHIAAVVNIGQVYLLKNDYSNSEKYLLEGIRLAKRYNNTYRLCTANLFLSQLYAKINYYSRANEHINTAIQLAQQNKLNKLLLSCYKIKSELLIKQNKFDDAVKLIDLYYILDDSLDRTFQEKKITDLKTFYQLDKDRRDNAMLKYRYQREKELIKRKNLLIAALIIILALSITVFVIIYLYTQQLFKLNKELLQQKKDISEANQQKDQFFSFVAHDLKNPINNIMGFSELMVRNLSKGNFDNFERYVGHIFKSSKTVNTLVDNLLEWSRLQRDSTKYLPVELEIKDILNDTIEFFRPMAAKAEVKLELKFIEGIKLHTDRLMLKSILRNLVSNAIQFNTKGGAVLISAEQEANMIRIAVEDDGIGISKPDINKLFRLDVRKDQIGDNENGGAGMGLILAQELAKKCKATIKVESELNLGSIFYFYIPAFKINKDALGSEKELVLSGYIKQLNQHLQDGYTLPEELIKLINEEIEPLYIATRKAPSIKDLSKFAAKVEHTGKTFALKPLIDYGLKLRYLIQQMQIDKVLKLIEEFEKMIELLKTASKST